VKEEVTEIVAAYLKHNTVGPDQVPALIQQVYASLTGLGQATPEPEVSRTPAIPIRRSVEPDAITCLDCGQKSKMLKRHLSTAHSLTPDEYRTRWKLPPDYPMTATDYSARRSELAKSAGLGHRRNRAGVAS
jgi:predicted transcriptional regulator